MKRTRETVLQKLEENRDTIRGFGVKRLGLFGSWPGGEATEASDLDFLVELEKRNL